MAQKMYMSQPDFSLCQTFHHWSSGKETDRKINGFGTYELSFKNSISFVHSLMYTFTM
jgi:hypothetical protein